MIERIHNDETRATWGPGPWQEEPDRIEWRDEATKLPCLIVRQQSGVLCGYAAVLPGHPLHGVDYGARSPALKEAWERRKSTPIGTLAAGPVAVLCAMTADDEAPRPEFVFEVHGGLTYSGACQGHVCHEPEPGESDAAWWFGFDCSHRDDLRPSSAFKYGGYGEDGVYRDVEYVRGEVTKLAAQLGALAPPSPAAGAP